MDSLSKLLKLLLLGLLIVNLPGCATSDEDLGYTRKTLDTSDTDNSYHGWSAPPKEVDPSK